MALQSSGQISLDDIHVEAGGTTGTQASINDSDIRGLISKSSATQMAFNEWYGSSNITVSYDSTVTTDLTGNQTSGTLSLIGVAVGDILVMQILSTQIQGNSSSYIPTVSGSWSTAVSAINEWYSGTQTYHLNQILYRRVNSTSENSYSLQNGIMGPQGPIKYHLHRFSCNASSVTHNDVETRFEEPAGQGGNGSTAFTHVINSGSAGGAAIAIAQKSYYGGSMSTSHPNYVGVPISTSPSTSSYTRYEHGDIYNSGSVSMSDVFVRHMSTGSDITVSTGYDGSGTGYSYSHCYLTMS